LPLRQSNIVNLHGLWWGVGIFNINKTVCNEADYILKETTWIKDPVATFLPDKNKVFCTSGKSYE
jgi:sulfide:quinone oxidoreductase